MLIDTHCHLNYSPLYENLDQVIRRAIESGVEILICVGTDIETSRRSIEIAVRYENVFATVGIHPHDSNSTLIRRGWQNEIYELAKDKRVVAVGEIGLDYYKEYSHRDIQRKTLSEQIEIAKSLRLPIVLHNRAADSDIKAILKSHNYYNAVLHCFSSNKDFAKEMIELGTFISFTGNITFGNRELDEVAKYVPFHRLMLETDSPFILPKGVKGKVNEPANIHSIASRIASIKCCSFEYVVEKAEVTSKKFFQIEYGCTPKEEMGSTFSN